MKLPAAWIAAAFAVGSLIARHVPPSNPAVDRSSLFVLFLVTGVIVAAGFFLLNTNRVALAAVFGAAAWICVGGIAMRLARQPEASSHISALISSRRVDISTALRWRTRLREDPQHLRLGLQYDVDLESVEVGGEPVYVQGGMRLSYFRNEREPEPPVVHAGDRIEVFAQAKEPRNYKDPGAFDRRAFLAGQNIHVVASLRHSQLLKLVDTPPLTLSHRIARLRGHLMKHIDSFFEAEDKRAAILRAMLFGDRHFIEHREAEAFQKSGAYHVLVIAGLHVAALVVFVFWACKRLRLPPMVSSLLTFAVLGFYLAVVEDRPPILRAALMAAIVLLARLLFRRLDILNTAAVAALSLLIARPAMLFDSSFQLSFLAIGTIGAIAIPWIERTSEPYRRAFAHVQDATRDAAHRPRIVQLRLDFRALVRLLAARLPSWLRSRSEWLVTLPLRIGVIVWDLMLISVALQIGMLPLMARDFHRVSLIGPVANIFAVPLTGAIVPVGFVALAVSSISQLLGHLLVKCAAVLVSILSSTIEWSSQLPHASYRVPGPPLWLLIAFFATLFVLAIVLRKKESRWPPAVAGALLALGLIIAIYPLAPRLDAGRLEVSVLDAGQGDSLFVAFPAGHTMLVDGGGTAGAGPVADTRSSFDIGEEVISPYLWSRGLKKLDVVALTHAHQDHLGGLRAVLDNFRVGALWISRDAASPALESLEIAAHAHGVPVIHEHDGESFEWDGVKGEVLWPPREDSDRSPQAKNNDSLVLRLQYAGESFLLAGDIERQAEHALATRGEGLHSDFLKVPHHGSKTSTTKEFLQTIAPSVAVISVGEANPHGHPHPDVLARLEASGVHILRTDRDGAVTVVSDGKSLKTSCYVPCQ